MCVRKASYSCMNVIVSDTLDSIQHKKKSKKLCIERTVTWCLLFLQSLFIPMVFLAQREVIIIMLRKWAGFSFPCYLFIFLFTVVFLGFFQGLKIIMRLIVPVIESLFFRFFLYISLTCLFSVSSDTVCDKCMCLDICACVSVSAENLEKSLRQMERQLLQLERDLETFSSPDDPDDMFFTKMAISFTHACIHSPVSGKYSFGLL